ncbi:hypothetical protein [Streptococcus plurextorum]|uniref:hypothetical protein n=1 Tax=Streptococcus plurextorum TaxID=456876 RepID=UPI00041656A4|nr:hypothetical protein [Streptococcus plurextorum]
MTHESIFRVLFQARIAKGYNSLIYFLQKIPWLGKKVPNRWYQADGNKFLVMLIKLCLLPIQVFGNTVCYVFFCSLAASILREVLRDMIGHLPSLNHLILTVMVILSVFLRPLILDVRLMDGKDVEANQAVRIFGIAPRSYFLVLELTEFIRGILARTLVFGFFFLIMGRPFWQGITFALFLAGSRLGLKMLCLQFFYINKNLADKVLTQVQIWGSLLMWGISSALVFLGERFSPHLFMGIPAGVIGCVLWLLSYAVLRRDSRLDSLARRLITHQAVKEAAEAANNIETISVQVKDKAIVMDEKRDASLIKRTGVSYLNALFMSRLGKHLNKGINIRLGVISAIGLMTVLIGYLSKSGQVVTEDRVAWQCLFITVIAGYYLYVGESYMKFCFYHLDRPLLKYHFYRRPDVILATLTTRFKSSLFHNFPIFVLLSLVYCLIYISFFDWEVAGLFLIILGQMISMVFFSLYFLYLYFLLQPFNDGMQSKSRIYNILRGILTYGAYHIFRLTEVVSVPVLVGIMVLLSLFIILGFYAVLRYAPKTFKLKP